MTIKLKGSDGAWKDVASMYLKNSSGVWKGLSSAYLKVSGSWKLLFSSSITPTIENEVLISQSTNSTTKLITLTGTNYHWLNSTGLTYQFKYSTDGSSFYDLTSSTTITNPSVGSSNTKTYELLTSDVIANVDNTYMFIVTATNSTYGTNASSTDSLVISGITDIVGLTNDSQGDTSLSFSWGGGTYANAFIYQYQTYTGGVEGSWSSQSVTQNYFVTINGLSAGTTYRIRVKGISGTTTANPGYSGNWAYQTNGTTVSAPTNTSTPTIARNAATNYIYSVTSNGGWTGSPTSYNYQWYYYRSLPYPPNNEYTLISGATSSSYTTNASYIGYDIYCAVSAVNAGGTSSAVNSNFITITETLSAPSGGSVTLSPSGTQNAGTTLTASTSGWSGSPTSYSIGIYASTSNPPSPGAIGTVLKTSSASSSVSYTITASDATSPPYYFKAFATASNDVGTSSQAESNVVLSQIGVPNSGSVSLTGSGVSGTSLTATTTGWSGSPTTYSVAIYAGTTAGNYNVLKAINSPTSSNTVSYTVTTVDASPPPYIFIAYATATNGSGTSSQVSSNTITSSLAAAPPYFVTPPSFATPPYFVTPPSFATPPYFFGPPSFVTPPSFVVPPDFVAPPYFTDPRK
jgi:hypothetical protein